MYLAPLAAFKASTGIIYIYVTIIMHTGCNCKKSAFLMNSKDLVLSKPNLKSINSTDSIYFAHFAMRYPVGGIPNHNMLQDL